MKIAIALLLALGLSQADAKKYEKGSTVTLQGCVVAAEAKDTWVLTNVKEWPIATSDMGKYGKRYYWLDKIGKDLRAHGGHTIQVTGKIDEVKKSEIEIKSGESDGGMTVEIEGPGTDVKTTAGNAQVSPIGALIGPGKDIPITLLKLKVDDIKMIAANCNQ